MSIRFWEFYRNIAREDSASLINTEDLHHSEPLMESFINKGAEKECISHRLEAIRSAFLDDNKCPLFADILSLKENFFSFNLVKLYHDLPNFIKNLKKKKVSLIEAFPCPYQSDSYELTKDGIDFLIAIIKTNETNWKRVTLQLEGFEESSGVFSSLFKQIQNLTCVETILVKTHDLTNEEQEEIEKGFKLRNLILYPLTIETKIGHLNQSKQLELIAAVFSKASPPSFSLASTQSFNLDAKHITALGIKDSLLRQPLIEEKSKKDKSLWKNSKFHNQKSSPFIHTLTSSGLKLIITILKQQDPSIPISLNLNYFAPPNEGFSPLFTKLKKISSVSIVDVTQHQLSAKDADALLKTLQYKKDLRAKNGHISFTSLDMSEMNN